jgi:hypothetical protein
VISPERSDYAGRYVKTGSSGTDPLPNWSRTIWWTLGGGDRIINFIPSSEFVTPEPSSVFLVSFGLLCICVRRLRLVSRKCGLTESSPHR